MADADELPTVGRAHVRITERSALTRPFRRPTGRDSPSPPFSKLRWCSSANGWPCVRASRLAPR